MNNLEIYSYKGVECVKKSINILGKKMDVCTFYIDGTLIDTGPKRAQKSFENFFEKRNINKVLLTHHHEDHSGNANLVNKKDTIIYASEKALKYLVSKTPLPLYRKVFWGERPSINATTLPETLELSRITLQVINTPGHCRDHVSFYCPERRLIFSGDVYVSDKTKVLYDKQNIHQTIRDIKKLLSYNFDTIFCSHAGIIKKGKEALTKKLNNLEKEKEKILDLYNNGYSGKKIDKLLYKGNNFISIISRNEMSSSNLVNSVIYDE